MSVEDSRGGQSIDHQLTLDAGDRDLNQDAMAGGRPSAVAGIGLRLCAAFFLLLLLAGMPLAFAALYFDFKADLSLSLSLLCEKASGRCFCTAASSRGCVCGREWRCSFGKNGGGGIIRRGFGRWGAKAEGEAPLPGFAAGAALRLRSAAEQQQDGGQRSAVHRSRRIRRRSRRRRPAG